MIEWFVLCWFLPFLILMAANAYYLYSNRFEDNLSVEMDRLKGNDINTVQSLNEVIQASREASYDGHVLDFYKKYKEGAFTEQEMLTMCSYYIRDNYSRNEDVLMAVLWFDEDPLNMSCNTYNTSEGGTYSYVEKYWKDIHEDIEKISKEINTKIKFVKKDNNLYLVRNLYTSDYEDKATLVLCINQKECFNEYRWYPEQSSITLHIDDVVIELKGKHVSEKETGIKPDGGQSGYRWNDHTLKLYDTIMAAEYQYQAFIRYDDSSNFIFFNGIDKLFVAMLFCLIPLIILLLNAFRRYVTRPINCLMDGAEEIEKGNLGYQLPYNPETTEFEFLSDSFNSMSIRLKHQFDHIYREEIALRDARIKALQLQINPHFMNNTLEIINWEARLSGNEKVSRMIENLAVLMNAGMDRKKEPVVPLREEMEYVKAYLYIVSERFGDRIKVENLIPEALMEYKVPRLILQPLIENAVEHGVAVKGTGTITLNGKIEKNHIYLCIINDGQLSDTEKQKIDSLINQIYDSNKESSVNIGIANVNLRLKMLFGESSGLKIEQMDPDRVCAYISIKI